MAVLFKSMVWFALSFAFDKAGNSIPAKIAMIAMTTNSSIKVNAHDAKECRLWPGVLFESVEFIRRIELYSSFRCLLVNRVSNSLSNSLRTRLRFYA